MRKITINISKDPYRAYYSALGVFNRRFSNSDLARGQLRGKMESSCLKRLLYEENLGYMSFVLPLLIAI